MAETPQFLTLQRHRDASAAKELVVRRVFVGLVGAVCVVALFNVFGQRPVASVAAAPEARLEVKAPTDLRGGLFFQGRFTIEAVEELRSATLVFDEGWLEGMHVNTIEPQPVGEASRDGKLALDYGLVPAGDRLVVYLQFQVNPTNVGRRSQSVALEDGERRLAEVDRAVTIYP